MWGFKSPFAHVMITLDRDPLGGEHARAVEFDGGALVDQLMRWAVAEYLPDTEGQRAFWHLRYRTDEGVVPLVTRTSTDGISYPITSHGVEPTVAQVLARNGAAGVFEFRYLESQDDWEHYLLTLAGVRPSGSEPRPDELAVADLYRLPWKRMAATRAIARRAVEAMREPDGPLAVIVTRDAMNPRDREADADLERSLTAPEHWTGADVLIWARDSGFLPKQAGAIWTAAVVTHGGEDYRELASMWADNGRTFIDEDEDGRIPALRSATQDAPIRVELMFYAGSAARMRTLDQYRTRGLATPGMLEELAALNAQDIDRGEDES